MECEGFSHPFKICYFSPFTPKLYPFILKNLPDDDCYVDLYHQDAVRADGTNSRAALLLDQNAPPFWHQLSDLLCSKKVEDIFREQLGFEGPAHAVVRLLRDFNGYKISPHQDSSKKLCTVQFYLAENDEQIDLGTSFYSQNVNGTFLEHHKLKFMPNTGYCFKVSDVSWHGCNFKVLEKPRNTLILTYYKVQ